MTILTNKDLEEIIKILDGSPYGSLRVTTSAFDLTVRREAEGWVQERVTLTAPNVIGTTQHTVAQAQSTLADEDVPGLISVRAPMVGTFYAAPKPGAAPFVTLGDSVDPTTTLGIIETMKLMNAVAAGATGTIIEILVTNGQMIQAGQTLMRIRP